MADRVRIFTDELETRASTLHLGTGFSATLLQEEDGVMFATRRWVFLGEGAAVSALLGPVAPLALAVEAVAEQVLESTRVRGFRPIEDRARLDRCTPPRTAAVRHGHCERALAPRPHRRARDLDAGGLVAPRTAGVRGGAGAHESIAVLAPPAARRGELIRPSFGAVLRSLAYMYAMVGPLIAGALMFRWVTTGAYPDEFPLTAVGIVSVQEIDPAAREEIAAEVRRAVDLLAERGLIDAETHETAVRAPLGHLGLTLHPPPAPAAAR